MIDQSVAQTVDPLRGEEWEAAIRANPGASFFHSSTWAKILSETYGFTPHYLRCGEGPAAGFLPVLEANSFISGRRGIALPFTDECDPLVPDRHASDVLFQAARRQAAVRKWRYIEVRGGADYFQEAPVAAEFIGHEVGLEHRSADALFANCTSATRRAVRKAEKSGVVAEFSRSPADMEAFFSLFCETRKRHGNPPQPVEFFHAIRRNAIETNSGLLVLAKLAGAVMAGAIFLHFGRSALFKFGASNAAGQQLAANNLVMWRALQWYHKNGYASLRLGRTSVGNGGLRHFKLGWGAREYPVKYFRYCVRSGAFVAGRDNSSGWQTRIFKLLPQRVSRSIGAIAYRHTA